MSLRSLVSALFVACAADLPVLAQTAATPAEVRAIAKEAYIYGFPMVDSYRIQHAYFVDRDNPEFKAPWNQIRNIPRVFTPADKAVQTYEVPSSLLVANPLNRYLLNSPMLPEFKRDADGGITLHVQHGSPGADQEANWLPAPNGPFFIAMRLYWPKPEALEGTWKQPPMRRVH
jgi:hypothetical protein